MKLRGQFICFYLDINECETENGQCEASCQNTVGSYNCGCPPGLRLQQDGKTCAGEYLTVIYIFITGMNSDDSECEL